MKKIISYLCMMLVAASFVYAVTNNDIVSNMINFWKFEDNLQDELNNVSLIESAGSTVEYANAKIGKGISLDLGDSIIGNTVPQTGKNFTVLCWVQFHDLGGLYPTYFSVHNTTGDWTASGLLLRTDDGDSDKPATIMSPTPQNLKSNHQAAENEPNFYLLGTMYDENKVYVIYNDTIDTSAAESYTPVEESGCFAIGIRCIDNHSVTRMDGIVDECFILGKSIDQEYLDYIYNNGNGRNFTINSSPSWISVAENVYDNHAINFTSDGGQACGYNNSGQYTICGPTEEESPTIRFETVGEADCILWNESKNWTTLNNESVPNCATTGGIAHVCSFPDNLELDGTHTLYISCKSGEYEINNFDNFPANKLTVTIRKALNATKAIEIGIESSQIWPGATIYSNRGVYVRNKNNQQCYGVFDKVAVYGSQRWAFNYVSLNEDEVQPFYNLSPVFYFLQMENITTGQIIQQVSAFINQTKT